MITKKTRKRTPICVLTDDTSELQDKPSPVKGRPTHYDPKFCDIIINVARAGGRDAAMALACGVHSLKTLYTWRKKYPEFQRAHDYCNLIRQEHLEALDNRFMQGKVRNGHYKSLEKQLQHLDPETYGSGQIGLGGTHLTQINVNGDLKAIQNLDMSELDRLINDVSKRLPPIQTVDEEPEESKGD